VNEEQFRERFREAIGTAPVSDLSRRIEAALSASPARRRRLALGSIAATLALVLVGTFAGWRLIGQHARPASVKALPTRTAPTPAAAASNVALPVCRMPVIVSLESGPPAQLQTGPGFITTETGQYTPDSSASVTGLPGGAVIGTNLKPNSSRSAAPAFYSESLRRWLPVDARSVSPDGASYVWERLLPAGSNYSNFARSELHRYDVATSTDRIVWTYAGSIDVVRWDASGVLVDTVPPNGGVLITWLVNPATSTAAQQASGFEARRGLTQLPGDPLQNGGFGYGNVPGAEFDGHQIYRIGSREPGTPEIVAYETAPEQRVTIYRGSQGDATSFDPMSGVGDAAGIWFTDYAGRMLWRWQPTTGLHEMALSGLPNSGPNWSIYETPAGACIPPR
jgi:hypothetical protein